MKSVTVKIRMTCPDCDGDGVHYKPRCEHPGCQRSYSAEELREIYYHPDWQDSMVKVKLPCGHELKNLRDEYDCARCGGEGEVEEWISLAQLKQLLRIGEDDGPWDE